MRDDEQVIHTAWRRLPRPTGHAADGELLDAVLSRHREPHRRYHTIAHVAWVLRTIDRLAGEITVPSVAVLHLAAIYHDAVYDARAPDNEARSADLAVAAGRRMGWDQPELGEVHRLILATAGHQVSEDDPAAAVLVDADLAILGADPAAYRAYATGVRHEYAHVDDAAWRTGRAAVLRHFLDRPHVFVTAPMRAEREHRARANLTAELAALAPQPAQGADQ